MPLRDLRVSPRRVLPARLLTFRAVRSGGPGGQHVNKVATRVVLSLDLERAAALFGADAAARLRRKLASRVDAGGRLTVHCGQTRSRDRNLELAQQKLEDLLREALARPRPRKATRPSAGSRTRRLDDKRRHARTKRLRSRPKRDSE